MNIIDTIEKYDLCLGCGLCSSVLGENKCRMKLGADGFYAAVTYGSLSKKDNQTIKQLCPGIHVETKTSHEVWGAMLSICQAWSTDPRIRNKAASGGVVTSLAIYLLEHKKVDAILHVGVRDDSYLFNELQISRTKDEVINKAQSRYAPALTFSKIKHILDSSSDFFAFIGKPCDMAAMQNLIRMFPEYRDRIRYYISIFCAGMPSYNATIDTWHLSGHLDAPTSLKYRGDGWPGNFKASFADGSDFQLSYNESWGKILGKQLGFRCKICPDGIGMLADIAVGDSWNTRNGYPDFVETDGRSFCMVRTATGNALISEAIQNGYIFYEELEIAKIKEQQPYQFQRRKLEGWRLLPVQIVTNGLLSFKGLAITRQALTANFKQGIANLVGTISRLRKMHGK